MERAGRNETKTNQDNQDNDKGGSKIKRHKRQMIIKIKQEMKNWNTEHKRTWHRRIKQRKLITEN